MKLLLLGAGIRTPLMIHGLLRRAALLKLDRVALFDADEGRLETMTRIASEIVRQAGGGFEIHCTTDFSSAATGADFIFSAIRVGQEQSRVTDERIALDAGVLGQETTGPGGFSMALRTIPVLLDYARIIERVAPDAWFVNFTNPAGLITQALLDHTSLKVIGICDTPTAMQRSISAMLGASMDEVFVDYVGLNHLGWVRDIRLNGQSRMQGVLDHYEQLRTFGHEWTLFPPALVRALGMLPNEYLYYFYAREQAIRNIAASGSTRGGQIKAINEPLWSTLVEAHRAGDIGRALKAYGDAMLTRSGSYMARESGNATVSDAPIDALGDVFEDEGYAGLAMDVMQAIVQDRPAALILNVRNGGVLAELQENDVIETTCMVDANGVHPLAQRPLEPTISGLVLSVKAYERLTVDAAVRGDRDAAVMGLAIHPLVLSWSLAEQLVDQYVQAHQQYLTRFSAQPE